MDGSSFLSPNVPAPPSVATGLSMPLSPGDPVQPPGSLMAPPSIHPPQSVQPQGGPATNEGSGGGGGAGGSVSGAGSGGHHGHVHSNRPSGVGSVRGDNVQPPGSMHSIAALFPPMTPRVPDGAGGSAGGHGGMSSVGPFGPMSVHAPHSSIHAVVPHTPAADQVPRPQLQNIVSTVNLGCKLDLKQIALHARNAEYNPKRFAAVIMRIREPRTTALIFSSGKMVCTGAKSEDMSRLAARKYARIVQKLGFDARFMDFKVQNMVGSCDVKFPIQLESLCLTHTQFSTYEPELFPGLIYKMVKPRVVLLIFVSGKVVITGAKERSDIDEAFNNIYPILRGFRKP